MPKAAKPEAPLPIMATKPDDGKTDYIVTDQAPLRVAGRRVVTGDTIRLSAEEALTEELSGHILPAEIKLSNDI